MATADEERFGVHLDEWIREVIIHVGVVGGGTAILVYAQSWYAEVLVQHPLLAILGLTFWLMTVGVMSWTMWVFILPSFLTARW